MRGARWSSTPDAWGSPLRMALISLHLQRLRRREAPHRNKRLACWSPRHNSRVPEARRPAAPLASQPGQWASAATAGSALSGRRHPTMDRARDAGWQERGIGQVPGLQAGVVRQPLRRGFLMTNAAGPWGLTASRRGKNRLPKVADGLALMAVCPKQQSHDLSIETSSRRVLRCHIPRLASRRKPWLGVTL